MYGWVRQGLSLVVVILDWFGGVLHDNQDEVVLGGHQDLVLLALDPDVGELVGRVQVPYDRLGPLRELGHEHRVLVWMPLNQNKQKKLLQVLKGRV